MRKREDESHEKSFHIFRHEAEQEEENSQKRNKKIHEKKITVKCHSELLLTVYVYMLQQQ